MVNGKLLMVNGEYKEPRPNNEMDEMQRTLIITFGKLAQLVGDGFSCRMQEREGPTVAIGLLDCSESGSDEAFMTAVTQTLTTISSPDLAAWLARGGRSLSTADEVSLILVVDNASVRFEKVVTLLKGVTAVIQRHLGLETASLLIWLAGEAAVSNERIQSANFTPFTRGIILLGLRNEAGLRLPDEATLAAICAEILWGLAATPLRTIPELMAKSSGHAFTGEVSAITLGITGWEWSPAASHAVFVQRWLQAVFSFWLATAETKSVGSLDIQEEWRLQPEHVSEPAKASTPDQMCVEQANAWMQANQITSETFAQHTLHDEERQLPGFEPSVWSGLWPWQIRPQFVNVCFKAETDFEACHQWEEFADLRMEEPLKNSLHSLTDHAETLLDEQPVGGVCRVMAWLGYVIELCDRQVEQMLDREESQAETAVMLTAEQKRLEARLNARLKKWPPDSWRAWLVAGWRFWRWPRLAWQQWQMQQDGQQLSQILSRQAAQRRRQIVETAVRQAWAELGGNVSHLQDKVEEVGDMLKCVADAERLEGAFHAERGTSELAALSIPDVLYERLIPDEAQEAIFAAAAIGGLGQQINMLDDAVLASLRQVAAERLAGVWGLTAVNALTATNSSSDSLQETWSQQWETARPLWRLEEARLDEINRMQTDHHAFVCGAGVQGLTPLLPDLKADISWMPSNDRQRLLLIRVRSGLKLAAI